MLTSAAEVNYEQSRYRFAHCSVVREERRITAEVVSLISVADERKLYLDLGFASLFDRLVRGIGYSESSAYRRIEAARLSRAVPEVVEKIKSGEVNLSTVAKARSAMRAHERKSGRRLSAEDQAEVVSKIENKSGSEAQMELIKMFPDSSEHQERKTLLSEKLSRLILTLPNEAIADLEWAMDFYSHNVPDASYADIISFVFKRLRESTSAAKKSRVKSACCEICGSQYQLQVDHIIPKAMGGTDDPSSLRVLCRQHNLRAAEHAFGEQKVRIEIARRQFIARANRLRKEARGAFSKYRH